MESYNSQLIRHNKLYSKIVSEFIANSETIISHLHSLPHHEVVAFFTQKASAINTRFDLMDTQFKNYERDVGDYRDYLERVIKEREEARSAGNVNNPANQE
jgi:hypothetical protein